MRARALNGSFNFMGGRFPVAVGLLIGLTLGASILGAVGLPLREWGALFPVLVWQGQVWRLLTWVFFELDPVSLIFACLMLGWFGRDLCHAWGARRFLAVYLGFAAAAAGATCLIARLVWPGLMARAYLSSWPLAEAMIIAWAVLFPYRRIFVYFLFPLGGRNLIYLTIGGTVLYALFHGPAAFVPHFVAEGLMLIYVREPSIYGFWLRLRLGALQWSPRRRSSHLRPVDRFDPEDRPRWLH